MENSKFHPFGEYIFCSTCQSEVEPKAMLLDEIEDEIIIEEKEETTYTTQKIEELDKHEELGKYKEKTSVPFYKKIFFVKCTNRKCKTKNGYLFIKKVPIDPKFEGNDILKSEVIPSSYDWHLFPIENPKDNENWVVPSNAFALYENSISCYNLSLIVPCGFLIGAIIEAVCIFEEIKPITFERLKKKQIENGKYKSDSKIEVKLFEMLKDLIIKKSLNNEFSDLLDALRKVRNLSAHPSEKELGSDEKGLTVEDLFVCIKSIEALFEELYIMNHKQQIRKQMAGDAAIRLNAKR